MRAKPAFGQSQGATYESACAVSCPKLQSVARNRQLIVDFVVGQVTVELPESVSQHLDDLLAGGAESEGLMDRVTGSAVNLFNEA